ncbi:MAG: phosphotransferase family protein [Deltaproteobacteria bacterium]|nr:MAG: phosphotransferase family protein [Deltaproteobacteria bacterium]
MLRRAIGRGLASAARLSGGASQETWAVDAGSGSDAEPLILRRRPGGASAGSGMALPLETEATLLGLAAQAKVPVPAVRHVLASEDGLGSGYLMQRLEGETIPRKILRDDGFADARPRLARQCGEILARIHAIPSASLPALRVAPAAVQWREYRDLYDGFGWPHPVFELAFRWIEERLPDIASARETLVHGDFRHGNLMIGPDGVRGVLDWELAHRGDPLEDLGWICVNSWRFGNIDLPVGGFGVREELFAGYEAAGGGRVDPERVRFWEVVGSLKWGIMCMVMLSVFERGIDRSVERAAIGRRASEAEIDLLALLEGGS